MSNFDIQYNFIAIDRFTKVAKKVQREAAKIASTMQKSTKALHLNSTAFAKISDEVTKTAKSVKHLGMVTQHSVKQTMVGMNSLVKSVDEGKRSFAGFAEYISRKGDEIAFKGYMQFMNVGFPILLAGKMGMDYVNQIQTGNYMMGMGLGWEKNYGTISKNIKTQAKGMSGKKTGFTEEQTAYTAGILAKTFGRADWTKHLLKAALIEEGSGLKADQAVGVLKQIILKGGKFMGVPLIGGTSLAAKKAAEKNIELLSASNRATKQLQRYSTTAAAKMNLLAGSFSRMMGIIIIQATPALTSFANQLTAVSEVVGNFLNKFPKISEGIVWGAFVGLGFTILRTIAGAIISILAMPLEMAAEFGGALKFASRALRIFTGATGSAAAAEEAETMGKAQKALLYKVGAGLALGMSAGALVGVYEGGKKRMQAGIVESQRLGYIRSHGFEGKKGNSAILSYAREKSLEGGGGVTGFTIPGLPGSVNQLRPVQQKIDMEIKVTEEGKIKSVHAKSDSPNLSLGVNMPNSLMAGIL